MLSLLRTLNPLSLILLTLLSGCTFFGVDQVTMFNDYQIYQVPKAENIKAAQNIPAHNNYLSEVKPIIDYNSLLRFVCLHGAA